jgi:hypothetical protein
MAGMLDKDAPSIEDEYVRFLEGDYLGKVILKNFCTHVACIDPNDVDIPIGKWGDALRKGGAPVADARIRIGGKWLDIEIKLARINIANKTIGQTSLNWQFVNMTHTPAKVPKTYDLVFAVGLEIMGFEHENYWNHLQGVAEQRTKLGYLTNVNARPHEEEYLNYCGFYLMSFSALTGDNFRRTFTAKTKDRYGDFFAWGYDTPRLVKKWECATERALFNRQQIFPEKR